MEIISGLQKDGSEYSDGIVLKADDGDIYRCKIWREGEKLMVRGYLGFFTGRRNGKSTLRNK